MTDLNPSSSTLLPECQTTAHYRTTGNCFLSGVHLGFVCTQVHARACTGVYVCARVQVCTHTRTYLCECSLKSPAKLQSQLSSAFLSVCLWGKVFHWSGTHQAGQDGLPVDSECTCASSPSSDSTSAYRHTWTFFTRVPVGWTWGLTFVRWAFCGLSHLQWLAVASVEFPREEWTVISNSKPIPTVGCSLQMGLSLVPEVEIPRSEALVLAAGLQGLFSRPIHWGIVIIKSSTWEGPLASPESHPNSVHNKATSGASCWHSLFDVCHIQSNKHFLCPGRLAALQSIFVNLPYTSLWSRSSQWP